MQRVLVVYASGSGCAKTVADTITAALQSRAVQVDEWPAAEDPDPAAYDAVVVGSGIRLGRWHDSVREWVADNATVLRARPVAFFTVCMTMATHPERVVEVRGYTDPLAELTGVRPVDVGTFAGWNEPRRFGFLERLFLRSLGMPTGDFRDLGAVAAWARGLGPRLGLATAPRPRAGREQALP